MNENILSIIELYKDLPKAKILEACDRRLYKEMPSDVDRFIEVCNELVTTKKWQQYWLVTVWIKRKQTALDIKYYDYFQKWLYEYTNSWGACDVFCYRILNPMIEKYPQLFENVLQWVNSEKVYVRRAAAVCLIHKTKYSFCINANFENVKKICDLLKNDMHIHIQKAVGWLLKYAYLTYPNEVKEYLKDNISNLSRTTFRYAVEKMEPAVRSEFMKLKF